MKRISYLLDFFFFFFYTKHISVQTSHIQVLKSHMGTEATVSAREAQVTSDTPDAVLLCRGTWEEGGKERACSGSPGKVALELIPA